MRPSRPGTHAENAPRASNRTAQMLRVDHAGEYAAITIYEAQARTFGRSPKTLALAKELRRMRDEEQEHLDAFDALLRDRQVRPTVMMPVWHMASTALGVTTALMGEKAAHACTDAVETVIEQHYAKQAEETKDSDPDLSARFTQFREDELRHRDAALAAGAKQAPAYPLLSGVIKAGCRAAIKISEKI